MTHPVRKTPTSTDVRLWRLNRKRWRKTQLSLIRNRQRAFERTISSDGERTLPLSPTKGGSNTDFQFFGIKLNSIE